jgi:predicted nucleic acid-binding protein
LIAADTSSLVAFFSSEKADDTDSVAAAVRTEQLILAPIVITELLSHPSDGGRMKALLKDIPLFELTAGFWVRAGDNRRLLLSKGLKARTADALIAQACIDFDVPLIARDSDFRHFAAHCGLKLA